MLYITGKVIMTYNKTTMNNDVSQDHSRTNRKQQVSPAHVLVKYPKSFSQHCGRMAEPKDCHYETVKQQHSLKLLEL